MNEKNNQPLGAWRQRLLNLNVNFMPSPGYWRACASRLAFLAMLVWACQCQATVLDIIKPSGVTATQPAAAGDLAHLLDNTGLSSPLDGPTVDTAALPTMPNNVDVDSVGYRENASPYCDYTFTLASASSISGIIIANYWEPQYGGQTQRGVTKFDLYLSTDNESSYTFAKTVTVPLPVVLPDGSGTLVFIDLGTNYTGVTHVKFQNAIAENRDGSGLQGLNEVRFTAIPAGAPLTVDYLGNGSTGGSVPVDANSPYTSGATVTVLGNTGGLSQSGYTFTNWNTAFNGSGTAYNPGATFVITQPTTLYAQWTYSPVTWGIATTVTGDADVATSGTLVYAYTESGVSATCNGVTFDAGSSSTSLGGGNVTLSGFGGVYGGYDPSGSFSTDYHNLITGGAYGGGAPGTVMLNNLTSGRNYLVQFWVADYRGDGIGRTEVLDSQTTLGYQPAQYAIGTFTANGTSQLIKIVPNASVQMNAIQVRDVTPGVVTLSPVLYNGNGATGGSVPVDGNSPYTNGVTVTVLGNSGGLSKPLCTFTNWNTAADGSGTAYNPGATFTITNNVTLYAQWTGQTITLIDPVSGTAAQSGSGSTNWGGQGGSMSNLFNSSGLSSTLGTTANSASLPVLNNGDMDATGWRATTFSTPSVDFTFDLGMTTNIMGIVLGNYFEPGQYARGVQSFDLQLSSDHGGTWTTVGTIYPALADASGQLQIIDFGTNYAYVTDVRFSHASNTGGSFGFIGLNEVRFLAGPYVAPPPRTLVYNGNGNTGGSVPVDGNSPYADGSTVTVLGNTGSLTKAGGATFAGWNTHANGSGTAYSPGNTFTLSANTTLYAQWNVNPITWQTPVNLAGDSDVATDGTLVYAYTESDTNGTVNGVTFAADGNYPTGLSSLGGGNVTLSGFTGGPGLGVWFTQTNPVSGNPADYSQNPVGLSVDYQNNIGGAAFGDVGASTEVLLNNLTPGRQYLVQFWVCDYRAASGRSETLSAGNVSGVLTYAQPVSGAASGTYVKGTFTAHSSGSQLITLLPAGSATAQMNAIMVRDVTVTAPPVLSYIQSGSGASATLTFNWTGSGSLEWQTNSLSQGLGTNWVAYPNGTNGVSVPVDTTKGSVFFRVKQ